MIARRGLFKLFGGVALLGPKIANDVVASGAVSGSGLEWTSISAENIHAESIRTRGIRIGDPNRDSLLESIEELRSKLAGDSEAERREQEWREANRLLRDESYRHELDELRSISMQHKISMLRSYNDRRRREHNQATWRLQLNRMLRELTELDGEAP